MSTPTPTRRPNVVVFLADDLGFSDPGCFGGEIDTPNLDALAVDGHRLSRFYTTARCSPSRASLMTGRHPHQVGIGILTQDDGPAGYPGTLDAGTPTIAEVLQRNGYRTHLSGKWHLARERSVPNPAWPLGRGFDSFFGTLSGCGNYFNPGTLVRDEEWVDDAKDPDFYYTDAIGDDAAAFVGEQGQEPFFLYVAFTAPHWPLHARPEDIEKYRGRFDEGWDVLRARRLERQRELGVVAPDTVLSERDPDVPAWDSERNPEWQASRMEVYAAQVESMDRAIGRVLAALDDGGHTDDTLVLFLADNGASSEELPLGDPEPFRERAEIFAKETRDGRYVSLGNDPALTPGPEDTYASYGRGWANLSNTPFRMFKEWVHEGGIASPTIVRWPAGNLVVGGTSNLPLQLVDVVPTLLEATGVEHPSVASADVPAPEGESFLQLLRGGERPSRPLYFEHVGNAAVRDDRWKLVRKHQQPWELYAVEDDTTERVDLAEQNPDVVAEMARAWEEWSRRIGVKPYADIVAAYAARGLDSEAARGS